MSNAPVQRRVRAYFAPVDRSTATPTLWDPADLASFNADAPPAPWLDLGWCSGFSRKSSSRIAPLLTGAPAIAAAQVRTEIDAQVSLEFESWGKLQLALSCGVQQLNLLARGSTYALADGSSATQLQLGGAAGAFAAGDLVVVDLDYAGTAGFIGSGLSGAYVKSAGTAGYSTDYVRRFSLNVARVTSVLGGVLTLSAPLLAGAPVSGMRVAKVIAFCDREGSSFFQEWSALFLVDGQQGERIAFHYPRLQCMQPAAESAASIGTGLVKLGLPGHFRALPVADPLDGEVIVCFRAYLPAPQLTPNNT